MGLHWLVPEAGHNSIVHLLAVVRHAHAHKASGRALGAIGRPGAASRGWLQAPGRWWQP